VIGGVILAVALVFTGPATASLKRVVIVSRLDAGVPPLRFPKTRTSKTTPPTQLTAALKGAIRAEESHKGGQS
jgi:hypothetical protein